MIFKMAEPITRVEVLIKENSRNIEATKETLEQYMKEPKLRILKGLFEKKTIKKMSKACNLTIDVLEKDTELKYPITVCTAKSCTSVIALENGEKTVNYKHCHEMCKVKDVENNIIGHVKLRKCSPLKKLPDGRCTKCGCDWKLHMHVNYVYKIVKKNLISPDEVKSLSEAQVLVEQTNKELEATLEDLSKELDTIRDISDRFYAILKLFSTVVSRFHRVIENQLTRSTSRPTMNTLGPTSSY